MAGPTGARAEEEPGRCELDMLPPAALKHAMHSSQRFSIEQAIAVLARRLEQLHGELSAQAEEIAARLERGKPASTGSLDRFDRQRDRFWTLRWRYEQLRARHPAPSVEPVDF